jgi:hypothetical protein
MLSTAEVQNLHWMSGPEGGIRIGLLLLANLFAALTASEELWPPPVDSNGQGGHHPGVKGVGRHLRAGKELQFVNSNLGTTSGSLA